MVIKLKNGLRALFSINTLLIWTISSMAVFLMAQIPIGIFQGEYLYFGDGRPMRNVVIVAVVLGSVNAAILPAGRTILSVLNSSSKLELYVSVLTMSLVGTYASLGVAAGILPVFSITLIPTALIVGAVLALIIIGFLIAQTKNQN